MKSLFSILKEKIQDTPVLRSANASLTVEEANKILGEIFGQEAMSFLQARYIKNDILHIWCQSPTVASEIRLNENEILAKIREKNTSAKIIRIKTIV
ncbi:MAG TPA: DciA family protein [Candidatus Magasanikbacteria bacterium]|nr:DciA family protein [Candidatus Magasanikbacteria bacterium]